MTAVAVAAMLVAPAAAAVGGTALQRQAEDLGGRTRAGAAAPLAELPCLVALVETGIVADMAAVIPVIVATCLRFGALAAGVAAWGSTIGLAVIVVAVAAHGAIVPPVAKPWLARAASSPIVLQLEILFAARMVMVVEATAVPWLMMTAMALGPIPIRVPMMTLGQERVLPNFFQLCVCRTMLVGPTRSTAALTSLTRALTLLASVMAGAKALVKAFIFLFASSFLAMLLKCCAQPLLKIAILCHWFGGGVVIFLVFLLFIMRSYSKSHQNHSKRLSALHDEMS
jgi:hypothetical protein